MRNRTINTYIGAFVITLFGAAAALAIMRVAADAEFSHAADMYAAEAEQSF